MSSLRQDVERFLCYTIENSAGPTKSVTAENRKAKPVTGDGRESEVLDGNSGSKAIEKILSDGRYGG